MIFILSKCMVQQLPIGKAFPLSSSRGMSLLDDYPFSHSSDSCLDYQHPTNRFKTDPQIIESESIHRSNLLHHCISTTFQLVLNMDTDTDTQTHTYTHTHCLVLGHKFCEESFFDAKFGILFLWKQHQKSFIGDISLVFFKQSHCFDNWMPPHDLRLSICIMWSSLLLCARYALQVIPYLRLLKSDLFFV